MNSWFFRQKRALDFGFLLMGFSFTVTQGLLIRELLVAFFGNELSIGLILGNWLVLEAVGSGLLGRLAVRWGGKASSYAALQILFAFFLPLCLLAAYAARSLVGAVPGEGVGLAAIFGSSLLILAPLALVDGAMFAFGSQAYATIAWGEALSIGWVYVLEAVGGIVGGLVFTFIFITFLEPLPIALLLAGLNAFSATLLLAASGPPWRKRLPSLGAVLVLLAASFVLLLSPLGGEIQRWTASQQWMGQNPVYSENSVYGNVTVLQQEEQYTFFADGIPILSAPVPDVALVEETVHLPLLFVPRPQRALVLSGGLGGVLHELAKYPLERIDYAELDPLLVKAVRQFPTSLTVSELGDPRLSVEYVDGRLLVRQKGEVRDTSLPQDYDLVIVNLPYPTTLQLNRFYTVEFFQMVGGLLSEDGVLVLSVPGTLTYMSDELRDLNAMAYHTLRQAFPHVRAIPGDFTLWLASSSEGLSTATVKELVARWKERGLETRLLTPAHIQLRLAPRYEEWFWASLGRGEGGDQALLLAAGEEYTNRDLYPVGLFHGLSYWNALFSPTLARVFALAGRLKLWMLGALIAGGGLLFLVIARTTARGRGAVVPIAIATTGFTGMTADLVIIFAFQTLYGHVYHWIGLLITAFMAGLSLGGLLMTRRLDRLEREWAVLLKLELILVVFWILVPLVLIFLHARIAHPLVSTSVQGMLFLLNVVAGLLVGSQFPLANKLWYKGRGSAGETAGALYASDLVGAFLGAVLVSVVLIPILGIPATCLVAAMLKLGSLSLVAILKPRALTSG